MSLQIRTFLRVTRKTASMFGGFPQSWLFGGFADPAARVPVEAAPVASVSQASGLLAAAAVPAALRRHGDWRERRSRMEAALAGGNWEVLYDAAAAALAS